MMRRKYRGLLFSIALLVLLPCTAFAISSLTINGSIYNSTALAGSPSGTGWAWSASANGGAGELTLKGYNGSYIASVDGVLNIRLIGTNTITSVEKDVLSISGSSTGLNLYGSDSNTDSLMLSSAYQVTSSNQVVNGIHAGISNSVTMPFTLRNISLSLDTSQIKGYELVPGFVLKGNVYGISANHTTTDVALLGITMQMDHTVITFSNNNTQALLQYGMWANPLYGMIEAAFDSCTFNLSDFTLRGWYVGRDLASVSTAVYNSCLFNIHGDVGSTFAIGLHVSADNDFGFGKSTLILNNPTGEIQTVGHFAALSRGSNPTLEINGSSMQAWQEDGTEIVAPHAVTVFMDASRTDIYSLSIGSVDAVYLSTDYDTLASHILFTLLPSPLPSPLPSQFPQTGDSSTPALYTLALLFTAAAIVLLRRRSARG